MRSGKQLSVFRKIRPETIDKGKGKEKAVSSDAKGHTDEVLCLALSDDGHYLASAGKDRKVVIWDVEKGEWLKSFSGHRDTIAVRFALVFRYIRILISTLYSGPHISERHATAVFSFI